MNNNPNQLNLIASILFFGILACGCKNSNSENSTNANSSNLDCTYSTSSYSSGYGAGKLVRLMNDFETCESFVRKANEKSGRNEYSADDCFCEGFNDGKDGKEEKYTNGTITTTNGDEEVVFPANEKASEKETQWEVFSNAFKQAINDKNRQKILELTCQNSEFSGDYNFKSDSFLSETMLNEIQASVEGGFKENYEGKITFDNVLIFKFQDNKWVWEGFMGD